MVCALCVGGVSFEDDINMVEDEMSSVSVEEQLQYSLDTLRDDVIRQHSDTQPSMAAAHSCVFFHLFLP